ncbi:MAG: hypothetical protein K2J14_02940, partial [Treponemataceae bacterium]|nr:hypothetical protein [Treponemataceae bacterium]
PLCRMLALLEAIAKRNPINLAQHYTQNIANATPTTLIRNVSLLHLTKQTAIGNALAQYWRDNANDAKRELDRIV